MKPNKTRTRSPVPREFRILTKSEAQLSLFPDDTVPAPMEKRSSGSGIAHMVQQMLSPAPAAPKKLQGVGARRRRPPSPSGGGGYQNICNIFEIAGGQKKFADPRVAELYTMGMQGYWLVVADYLGMDKFLGMWRLLDSIEASIPKGKRSGAMALMLRPYANFERFQKNRYVATLVADGHSPKEIQAIVKRDLKENMTISNIGRLARKHKIRA
ncbi:hypothetical protein [Herbaspirillum huttiense]